MWVSSTSASSSTSSSSTYRRRSDRRVAEPSVASVLGAALGSAPARLRTAAQAAALLPACILGLHLLAGALFAVWLLALSYLALAPRPPPPPPSHRRGPHESAHRQSPSA